jgi:hypothetical protein
MSDYGERSLSERRNKVGSGDVLIAYLYTSYSVRFFKVLKRTPHYITVRELQGKCIARGHDSKRVFRASNSVFWYIPSNEPAQATSFKVKIYDNPKNSEWDCEFTASTFRNFYHNRGYHNFGVFHARVYTGDLLKCVINDNNEYTPDWIVSKEEFLREFQETQGKFEEGFDETLFNRGSPIWQDNLAFVST